LGNYRSPEYGRWVKGFPRLFKEPLGINNDFQKGCLWPKGLKGGEILTNYKWGKILQRVEITPGVFKKSLWDGIKLPGAKEEGIFPSGHSFLKASRPI